MADLGGAEQALDRADGAGRGQADGLVEAEPAGDRAALAFARHLYSFIPRPRSRFTSGERSSASIRSPSSKECRGGSGGRARSAGRRDGRPRRAGTCWWRSSAATSLSAPLPPSGMTKTVASLQIGRHAHLRHGDHACPRDRDRGPRRAGGSRPARGGSARRRGAGAASGARPARGTAAAHRAASGDGGRSLAGVLAPAFETRRGPRRRRRRRSSRQSSAKARRGSAMRTAAGHRHEGHGRGRAWPERTSRHG